MSADCKEAFDKLKTTLTQAPIVRGPDWSQPFEIMCDASNYAVGVALAQREVEIEHKAFWAVRECNMGLEIAGAERKLQLQELESLCLEAYENSKLYKDGVKVVHDKNINRRYFRPGELVLLYNSRLRLMLGKLRSRWEGPYRVEKAEPYDVFYLRHPSSPKILKVNGHRLKLYHGEKMHNKKELEIFLLEDPPSADD
ncbi:uncharacterized protein [Arachis hypogaea]|uniref:uncharacterized protein n=1 Tax=Arachis hypogaea TaxID=3818 RepID=UPI000DEC8B49|nr:uncharacterized protein LOC112722227 [Arachis hypogaea]